MMVKKLIAVASVLSMLFLLVSPAAAFSPGKATTTADWLNLRSEPGMAGRVIDMIPGGSEINIIQDMDEWCLIEWNGITGYVTSQYLAQELSAQKVPTSRASGVSAQDTNGAEDGASYALILADEVRFRQAGSLSGDVIGYFYRGVIVKVLEAGPQWTKVEFKDKVGYVSSQYIQIGTPTPKEKEAAETAFYIFVNETAASQSASSAPAQTAPAAQTVTPQQSVNKAPAKEEAALRGADDIIASAKACLGVPYQYGGTDMRGFDCSGFTYYVFSQNGISLNRTATAQYYQGTIIEEPKDLLPGDLVFFRNEESGPNIGHVGIYIGDGKLIHASSSTYKKIVIADLDSIWFATYYYGACRILK